jgi:hypothetical protein
MNQPVRTSLYEASHLLDLTALLKQIHACETALPDFQGNFVWETTLNSDSGSHCVHRLQPCRIGCGHGLRDGRYA